MSESKDEGARSFTRILEQVADGRAHAEASTDLQKLVENLSEIANATSSKAKGKFTIVLDVQVEASGIVAIGYDIKIKEPAPPRASSVFWLTKGKNLTVENPRQQKLPLVDVSKQAVQAEPGARDVADV